MSNKVVIKFDRKGLLKCDACGHIAEEKCEVSYDHVGEKCPKCGAVWCTKEDVDAMISIFDEMDEINAMLGEKFGVEPESVKWSADAMRFKLDSSKLRKS